MLGDNFYHRLFFGDMCAFDSPFLRIKIVGAMADILLEAQRNTAIAEQNEAARQSRRQCDRLFAQKGDGLPVI